MALLPSVPHWFIARKDLPPKDLKEFIAYLKATRARSRPVRSAPAGSSAVCSYYFGKVTGARTTSVPYRGGAPAMQDIVAGNVDMMCDLAANSLAQVRAGTIKAYAVTSKKRWFAAPELPTADEAGVPGLDLSNWLGAYAPRARRRNRRQAQRGFAVAMAEPAVRQRIADQGMEIPPPEQQTPEGFAVYLKSEMDKWGAIIRESGIKVQ